MPGALLASSVAVLIILALNFGSAGCSRPDTLTAERAESLIRSRVFSREPIYAEVPQRVSYGPRSPKDDYDEKAVRTLRNLESAGLLTVTETGESDGTETWAGRVTSDGFRILGTMPSARGPVFRGKIAEKVYDRVQNFVRHPADPLVGRAELVWHYENPTPLYPLFETKIDKPLDVPFVSVISIHWEDHQWRIGVIVPKKLAK
ncbi:MAG TPA: hypothetical protein VMT00_00835 [Thermoanaerobaculia bacterium]|nr:hypothetical protein [Thermoanaerobaculia bacterium]